MKSRIFFRKQTNKREEWQNFEHQFDKSSFQIFFRGGYGSQEKRTFLLFKIRIIFFLEKN